MRAWLVGPGLERPSRAPRRREEVGRVDGWWSRCAKLLRLSLVLFWLRESSLSPKWAHGWLWVKACGLGPCWGQVGQHSTRNKSEKAKKKREGLLWMPFKVCGRSNPLRVFLTNEKGGNSRAGKLLCGYFMSLCPKRAHLHVQLDWFLMKKTREDSCNTNMLGSYRHIMYTLILIFKVPIYRDQMWYK